MSVSTAPSVAKNTEIVTTQATNTSDEKIYIDNKTGKILTTINTEKSEDYTAYSSNQKISVFLPKLITSGFQNAIGERDGDKVTMTVAQYRDYKNQVEKDFKILFDNSTKQEEKNAILLQSLKTIVDSKLDLPLGDNVNIGSYQLVQYATLINVLGKKNLPATQESAKKKSSLITTTNKSAGTQTDDANEQVAGLIAALDDAKASTDAGIEANSSGPIGFFDKPIAMEDTSFINIATSTTVMKDGQESTLHGFMVGGNGVMLRNHCKTTPK